MKSNRTTEGLATGTVLVLLGVFAVGLILGWTAHALAVHQGMNGGLMGMMGGQNMHGSMHGERAPGMMNNGMDRQRMRGMMHRMMGRMMEGEGCVRMMRMMENHHQAMMRQQDGERLAPMGRMLERMNEEERRQHCRSMQATVMAMMDGTDGDGTESDSELDLEGELREWVDSLRGDVEPRDARGEDTVTVEVGAGDLGLQFSPAVLRIDPGTTVEFVWTGNGGSHDVSVLETDQRSPLMYGEGERYEVQFDEPGAYRYICTPHEVVGMKGLLLVDES